MPSPGSSSQSPAPDSILRDVPPKYRVWVYLAAAILVLAAIVSPRFRAFVLDDEPAAPQPTPVARNSPGPVAREPSSSGRGGAKSLDDSTSPSTNTPDSEASKGTRSPGTPGRTSGPVPPRPGADTPSPSASTKVPAQGPPTAPPPSGPKPGELTEIRKGVFRSTAGLIYGRGGVDGHRLDHVMEHARDNKEKPVHGVFLGNREEILAVIDEAYELALKRGPPTVRKKEEGDRTVYLVDMKRKIGYLGGQVGDRKNHPPCRLLQLVLEENDVITAFPTDR